jgi:hypothetical protein
MNNQKKYTCTLDQNDLNVISQLINQMPLGTCNVSQAAQANSHAQQILDFLGSKTSEDVVEEAEMKKSK